jgi:hypothetical protein
MLINVAAITIIDIACYTLRLFGAAAFKTRICLLKKVKRGN